MRFDGIGETVLAWMEAVRGWLLEQSWLSAIHPWITELEGSTIWAILVVSVAALVLLIGFWPSSKPKLPRKV
jgi:hypothetical protein